MIVHVTRGSVVRLAGPTSISELVVPVLEHGLDLELLDLLLAELFVAELVFGRLKELLELVALANSS